VAVVGKEDEQGLVKPMAYVVLREGYEPSPELEDEIKKNGLSTDLPNTNTYAG
jgi:benzoate-CoA ligase